MNTGNLPKGKVLMADTMVLSNHIDDRRFIIRS